MTTHQVVIKAHTDTKNYSQIIIYNLVMDGTFNPFLEGGGGGGE